MFVTFLFLLRFSQIKKKPQKDLWEIKCVVRYLQICVSVLSPAVVGIEPGSCWQSPDVWHSTKQPTEDFESVSCLLCVIFRNMWRQYSSRIHDKNTLLEMQNAIFRRNINIKELRSRTDSCLFITNCALGIEPALLSWELRLNALSHEPRWASSWQWGYRSECDSFDGFAICTICSPTIFPDYNHGNKSNKT